MKKISIWLAGPFLIMLAGALWSLDAIIRSKIGAQISPSMIVFLEHLIGFFLLTPFLPRAFHEARSFKKRDWTISILIAVVASVLGTLLFTTALEKSFGVYDFTTPIFLQKFQPIFAIFLAVTFLGEKLTKRFYGGLLLALIGSYLVTFGAHMLEFSLSGKTLIFLLSLGAAFAWGSGTVLGRSMTPRASFSTLTVIRFLLALPVALSVMSLMDPGSWNRIVLALGENISVGTPNHSITMSVLAGFVLIGLTTGAGALLIYYQGLKNTPAHIATLCELTFPIVTFIVAITALNPYGSPELIDPARIIGMVILLSGIVVVSWPRSKK